MGLRVDSKSLFPPPLNLACIDMDGAKFGLGFDCSDGFGWGGKAEIRGTFDWEKLELFERGIVIDVYKTRMWTTGRQTSRYRRPR